MTMLHPIIQCGCPCLVHHWLIGHGRNSSFLKKLSLVLRYNWLKVSSHRVKKNLLYNQVICDATMAFQKSIIISYQWLSILFTQNTTNSWPCELISIWHSTKFFDIWNFRFNPLTGKDASGKPSLIAHLPDKYYNIFKID